MTDQEKLDTLNDLWNNYCVSNTYEPGSTFKPLPYRQVLNLEILQEMRIMSAAVYCTWEIMTFTVVTDQDTGRRR